MGAPGRTIAAAKELDGKHSIKPMGQLFSTAGVNFWKLFGN